MQLSPRTAAIAPLFLRQRGCRYQYRSCPAAYLSHPARGGGQGNCSGEPARHPGQARQTVSLFNQQYKIDLRLGDGLEPLRPEDEVDVVVMAGLGGRTICRLRHAGRSKGRECGLYSAADAEAPCCAAGWCPASLLTERLVEGRRIYEIIVAGQGRERVADPLLYELGPVLVREKDPLLVPFIQQKIKRCQAISSSLRQSSREECRQKLNYYLQKEERLKEVLELVSHGQADS